MKFLYIFFVLYYFAVCVATVSGHLEPSVILQATSQFLAALLFINLTTQSK